MDKWKDKSLNVMQEAMTGDPIALYMIGLCLLYGHGMPINVSQANTYFAASASLGFAPAIDKIRAMYMEDQPNPYLSLVYVNLVTSFGHLEYSIPYHQRRTRIIEKFGKAFVDEMERIASTKMLKIIENQRKIKEAENKLEAVTNLMLTQGIVCEDICYDSKYWESLWKSKKNEQQE